MKIERKFDIVKTGDVLVEVMFRIHKTLGAYFIMNKGTVVKKFKNTLQLHSFHDRRYDLATGFEVELDPKLNDDENGSCAYEIVYPLEAVKIYESLVKNNGTYRNVKFNGDLDELKQELELIVGVEI